MMIRLVLLVALVATWSCRRAEPEPEVERRLLASLDNGLELDVEGTPAKDLRLQLRHADLTTLCMASRRALRQSLVGDSGPSAEFVTRSDTAVILEPDGAQDGALLLRLTHPVMTLTPPLGTSASRLVGLASKASFRLTRTRDGAIIADVLAVADAVAPIAATWAASLSLALPKLPAEPVSTGDTWGDRVEVGALGGAAPLTVERAMTLRGTVPCRVLSGDCAVVVGEVRLAQSAHIGEDSDTVVRVSGEGHGRLLLWLSVAKGLPDGAELRYSMDTRVERATTGAEDTVIRQAWEGVVVLSPPEGEP